MGVLHPTLKSSRKMRIQREVVVVMHAYMGSTFQRPLNERNSI